MALFAALAAVAILTFQRYGIAADGPAQRAYSHLLLRYFSSLGADDEVLYRWNWCLYGGFFELLAAAAERISPFGGYETRHLVTAASGLLAIGGCWKTAALLAGAPAGFWAAVLLALTPAFYGQMFLNTKDVPFAAGYAWSVYFILRAIPDFPRVPLRRLVALGVSMGLTLGVRVGGMILPCLLGAAMAAFLAAGRLRRRRDLPPGRTGPSIERGIALARLGRAWLGTAALAYLIMLVFWPYAQHHPLSGPWHALAYFTHFVIPIEILYRGAIVKVTELPLDYVPTYLAISLPELVLLLLGAGSILALRRLARRDRGLLSVPAQQHFFLVFAVVFPVAYVIVRRSALYNGLRHLLFVLPPLTALAGIVLAGLLARLRRAGRRPFLCAAAALLLYGGWHLAGVARLFPYEYAYVNLLGGGLKGAEGRYELEYLTSSLSAVARHLAARMDDPAFRRAGSAPYRVLVCPSPGSAAYYFPASLTLTDSLADADFYLASTHTYCRRPVAGETMFEVRRMGALLAFALDRRGWGRF